jgi:hypothetical protein
MPSNGPAIQFWSLVIAGLLLILGCLVDGI